MAFNPITVNKGPSANPHIYAEDDAAIFQSMFGEDGILDIGSKLELSIQSNNLVRMSDGALCVGGHIGRIKYADYVDLTIDNGETGHNRNDLIIGSFRNTGEHTIDTFEPQVVKGTPATGDAVDPTLTEGSLYEGEYLRQVAVARVKLEGLNIVGIDMLLPVIPSIPSLEEQLAKLNRKLNKVYRTKPVSGVEVVRVGNTVTLNVNRVVEGVQGNFVYSGHFGTVPPGYRPATENSLLLVGDRIVGSTVVGKFYASIFPDGKIEWSSENSHSGPNSYVFYATYVTSDQLPVE